MDKITVYRLTLALGAVALALVTGANASLANSEIDAFDKAATSGSKEDALSFIHEFGSSHLVPDLIDLLPPDVAAAVCADLGGNRACNNLQDNLAKPDGQRDLADQSATRLQYQRATPAEIEEAH
jgi:hypothetical protein